jgi:hypothetical protein
MTEAKAFNLVVSLDKLVGGTRFEHDGRVYEKTNLSRNDKGLVHPVVTGLLQPSIEIWLPFTTQVSI